MKSQPHSMLESARAAQTHWLEGGRAITLGPQPGELTVIAGQVWLTRNGDLGDHVIEAGRVVKLGADEGAVVEPWGTGEVAAIEWRRARQPLRLPLGVARALAAGLRGLAGLAGVGAAALRGVEGGLAALARKAAPSARRAQLCISGAASMASSGALK